MGKETEKLKLLFQGKSKFVNGSFALALVSALVYLGVDIGTAQEKIENLEEFTVETKADIRNIDNEINALGLFNSKEHNDLTNDIILIHERIEVLKKQIDAIEKKSRYEKRARGRKK